MLALATTPLRDGGLQNGPQTGPIVKCGDTALMLTEIKPEGGSLMDGASFLRGRPLVPWEDRLFNE